MSRLGFLPDKPGGAAVVITVISTPSLTADERSNAVGTPGLDSCQIRLDRLPAFEASLVGAGDRAGGQGQESRVGVSKDDRSGPERIVAGHRLSRWMRVLAPALAVFYIVHAALVRDDGAVVFAIIWTALGVSTAMRPAMCIDGDGVTLPVLRRRRIRWDQVASVLRPGRFDAAVSLVMVDGRRIMLPGVGPALAASVAQIGGKSLSEPAVITPRQVPPAPTRTSPPDAERDLQRRAAALQKRAIDLQVTLSDIQRMRPHSD